VALVVEIADSSLLEDRRQKYRVYASAGVGLFWTVNLIDAQVEVFCGASGMSGAPGFARHDIFRAGDSIPLSLDGVPVEPLPVNDLLP
jgi:hypothetical protein